MLFEHTLLRLRGYKGKVFETDVKRLPLQKIEKPAQSFADHAARFSTQNPQAPSTGEIAEVTEEVRTVINLCVVHVKRGLCKVFDSNELDPPKEQSLESIALTALKAKTKRLKATQGQGCMIGFAFLERASAPLPPSAPLEAQQLCNGRRGLRSDGFKILAHQRACTFVDLRMLGCVRVLIEGPGWWVRQSSGQPGWCLFLQSWNRCGWVAWWEGGQVYSPVLPFIDQPNEGK